MSGQETRLAMAKVENAHLFAALQEAVESMDCELDADGWWVRRRPGPRFKQALHRARVTISRLDPKHAAARATKGGPS